MITYTHVGIIGDAIIFVSIATSNILLYLTTLIKLKDHTIKEWKANLGLLKDCLSVQSKGLLKKGDDMTSQLLKSNSEFCLKHNILQKMRKARIIYWMQRWKCGERRGEFHQLLFILSQHLAYSLNFEHTCLYFLNISHTCLYVLSEHSAHFFILFQHLANFL